MNTSSHMPLKRILNNSEYYIHEYNFFLFRFHQFWWDRELESIRIYRMRGSSAFDCKLSMKLRGTPLRRINKILKLTAAENDEKIIQFYARLYTPHCRYKKSQRSICNRSCFYCIQICMLGNISDVPGLDFSGFGRAQAFMYWASSRPGFSVSGFWLFFGLFQSIKYTYISI